MKRQILSILLTFVMVFNLTTFASATSVSNEGSANTDISTLSAGLAWGPVIVGNIQFSMTNPHKGNVGPYGWIEHINLHIRNVKTKKEIANYHLFKGINQEGRECFIAWDSVTKTTVFQHCDNDGWTNAVTEFAKFVQGAVSDVLDQADFWATVVIGGLLIVAIVDLILPMDPIPVIPFSAKEAA